MIKPAIVVIGFNRPDSIHRLLFSLSKSKYNFKDIPLIISIDFQESKANKEVVEVAENFEWNYGEKEVIVHSSNLGLRAHIISCGDLTDKYESIIILEDDLVVSPNFYNYSFEAVNHYLKENNVAGISLYAYEYEELGWFKFYPLNNGSENYFMQWASSWGQIWTKNQWIGFKNWYKLNSDISNYNVPDSVKTWDRSWKKYFIAYLVDKNKYFVYPHNSYTTLIDETGTHREEDSRTNQVSLVWGNDIKKIFNFSNFKEATNLYDCFFQPVKTNIKLNSGEDISVEFDFYGTKKEKNITSDFVITSKNSKNPLKSYSNKLIPYEVNIFNNISGSFFKLTKKENMIENTSYLFWGKKLYGLRKIYAIKEMINVVLYRVLFKFFKK